MFGAVLVEMVASLFLSGRTCHYFSTFYTTVSFMQPTKHAVSILASLQYTGKEKILLNRKLDISVLRQFDVLE